MTDPRLMDAAGWSMSASWGRLGRMVSGWALIALGVIGCVLPVLPGIPLLLGGLALLSTEYAWAGKALGRLKAWIARARDKTRTRQQQSR